MSDHPASTETDSHFDAAGSLFSVLRYLSHARLMLICAALGIMGGLVYFVFGVPTYYSRALVRVTILSLPVDSDSGKVDGSNPALLTARGFALRTFQQQLMSDYLQTRVARRLGVAGPTDSAEAVRESVFHKVEISFVDTDHLEVGIYSPVPKVVREYAKTLIEEYENSEREVRENFRKTALDTYLREMDEHLLKLDEHLKERMDFEQSTSLAQVFIQQNRLTQVPTDLVLAKDRLTRMQDARDYLKLHGKDMDTVAKLSLLNTTQDEKPPEVGSVVRDPTSGAIAPVLPVQKQPEVVVSPDMVESLQPWRELAKNERQLKEELRRQGATYQPGHEVMKKLSTELAAVEDKLKAELDVATQRFDVEYAHVEDKIKTLEAKMPEYNDITARYQKFRQDYDLMQKGQLDWNKAHAQMAMNVAKLEFGADKERLQLDFAGIVALRDVNPVSPNKMKLAMVAGGLALMLAMGVPTLLMMMDTTASQLQQLEAKTGLKGIGIVPMTDSAMLEDIFRSPMLETKSPSFVLETYRIIRNFICTHPGRNGKGQVIMVTSARPSEGKTLMAANLAWAFHTMGEKTLLVDCDLRRGRVGNVSQVANEPGMSRLLVDNLPDKQAILDTDSPGLDVIPRGPIITGSTEMLCQKRFDALVEGWRARYDRIILDTPPVLGLGETSTLQRVTDGVVIVVKAHSTPLKDVGDAVQMLRTSGAHLYGMVLNAVDMSKMANYYHYYYYSPDYYETMQAARPA